MVEKQEMDAIKARAHVIRMSMYDLCKLAGVHHQSWYRAYKRGRADYKIIRKLEGALDAAESMA